MTLGGNLLSSAFLDIRHVSPNLRNTVADFDRLLIQSMQTFSSHNFNLCVILSISLCHSSLRVCLLHLIHFEIFHQAFPSQFQLFLPFSDIHRKRISPIPFNVSLFFSNVVIRSSALCSECSFAETTVCKLKRRIFDSGVHIRLCYVLDMQDNVRQIFAA